LNNPVNIEDPSGFLPTSSPEGGYAVAIPELPGCITQADTANEALAMIEDAKNAGLSLVLRMASKFLSLQEMTTQEDLMYGSQRVSIDIYLNSPKRKI